MQTNSPDAMALHSVYEILIAAGRRARQEAEERQADVDTAVSERQGGNDD
jgi:DNA-directed RNA polymerase subunit K/omega